MAAIKRSSADKWYSLCVRIRANWACERCGTYYPEGHRQGLHCSHVVTRGNHATRYLPINGISLCWGCHRIVGGDLFEHKSLYFKVLGDDNFSALEEAKQKIVRKKDRPIKEIAAHYRKEYERMEALRFSGEIGRIDFAAYGDPHGETETS